MRSACAARAAKRDRHGRAPRNRERVAAAERERRSRSGSRYRERNYKTISRLHGDIPTKIRDTHGARRRRRRRPPVQFLLRRMQRADISPRASSSSSSSDLCKLYSLSSQNRDAEIKHRRRRRRRHCRFPWRELEHARTYSAHPRDRFVPELSRARYFVVPGIMYIENTRSRRDIGRQSCISRRQLQLACVHEYVHLITRVCQRYDTLCARTLHTRSLAFYIQLWLSGAHWLVRYLQRERPIERSLAARPLPTRNSSDVSRLPEPPSVGNVGQALVAAGIKARGGGGGGNENDDDVNARRVDALRAAGLGLCRGEYMLHTHYVYTFVDGCEAAQQQQQLGVTAARGKGGPLGTICGGPGRWAPKKKFQLFLLTKRHFILGFDHIFPATKTESSSSQSIDSPENDDDVNARRVDALRAAGLGLCRGEYMVKSQNKMPFR
ncbi:unnamed protein product [Trichogramma brassicae]|uniref:Uncharacterized protein n=1 Tax=Trichogramma brassicae TaxID=86971 RepID=A0A6H5IH05_9HYME|nr:unnamed protein product [Trichogramma brassicae]